ncbi:4'-phosphopantetheinyl transferase superfamily protein [Paenibacillus sp. NAIST15-1]|uniref:4'-phosphopantetheinyl transferase family protein n=1 Tax=Paenibacillus sp. NAIST15-1 TaxID=1605994 RepID=UPI00086A6A35|nr:4'-phosphopantetheinyl transferase superfamily protein [Paenibacillus sp. NAIST15-1]GAV14165.1 putative phosphopantetheinyl transferase [Paenibacillus sp. NAIST15-1]
MKVIAVRIDSMIRLNDWLPFLSPERRERVGRFYREMDSIRCVLSELVAKSLIIEMTGCSSDQIAIQADQFGKPYMSGPYNHIQFNISHSGTWVVGIANDQDHPVGIDIEQIDEDMELGSFASILSIDEKRVLDSVPVNERIERFIELWTYKESYVKADGKGLSMPIDLCSFTPSLTGEAAWQLASPSDIPYYWKSYSVHPNYKMTACSAYKRLPETCAVSKASDFLQRYVDLQAHAVSSI